jgi:hypothetical protein
VTCEKKNSCELQDMGTPSLVGQPADFVVTVYDVQDTPPVFFNLPYNAALKETDAVVTFTQRNTSTSTHRL